jgi:hypothetical protein
LDSFISTANGNESFNTDMMLEEIENRISGDRFKRIELNYEQISVSLDKDRELIKSCIKSSKENFHKLDSFTTDLFKKIENRLEEVVYFFNETSNLYYKNNETSNLSIIVSYFGLLV